MLPSELDATGKKHVESRICRADMVWNRVIANYDDGAVDAY
jgi:hypothetical protein